MTDMKSRTPYAYQEAVSLVPASMEALVAELGRRTETRTLPPAAPAGSPGRMPDDLLARYGLMWLDELDPLAPRGH